MRIEEHAANHKKSPTDGRLNESGPAQIESGSGKVPENPDGVSLDTPSRVGSEIGADYLKEKNAEISKDKFENDLSKTQNAALNEGQHESRSVEEKGKPGLEPPEVCSLSNDKSLQSSERINQQEINERIQQELAQQQRPQM